MSPVETEDEVVIDLRSRDSTAPAPPHVVDTVPPPPEHRDSGSTHGSGSLSSGYVHLSTRIKHAFIVMADFIDAVPTTLPLRQKHEHPGHQRLLYRCLLRTWKGD